MGYRSQFDITGENQIRGETAESVFERIAISLGYKVETARGYDNYGRHIDKIIWNDSRNERFNVQVKSPKKINRNDSQLDYEHTWIEFSNVKGDKGWLYGESDIIAFDREKDFLIIRRIDLVNLCESMIDFSKTVDRASDSLYQIYTRRGRADKISLVKIRDIETLENTIWVK